MKGDTMRRNTGAARGGPALVSLEDVDVGRRVRVLGMRYSVELVGDSGTGVRPGAELRCVDRLPGSIVVETEDGATRKLPRSAASSISVELLDPRR